MDPTFPTPTLPTAAHPHNPDSFGACGGSDGPFIIWKDTHRGKCQLIMNNTQDSNHSVAWAGRTSCPEGATRCGRCRTPAWGRPLGTVLSQAVGTLAMAAGAGNHRDWQLPRFLERRDMENALPAEGPTLLSVSAAGGISTLYLRLRRAWFAVRAEVVRGPDWLVSLGLVLPGFPTRLLFGVREGVAERRGAQVAQRAFAGREAASVSPVLLYFLFSFTSPNPEAVCEAGTPAMLQTAWRQVSEHPLPPSHPFDVKREQVSPLHSDLELCRLVASIVHLSLWEGWRGKNAQFKTRKLLSVGGLVGIWQLKPA